MSVRKWLYAQVVAAPLVQSNVQLRVFSSGALDGDDADPADTRPTTPFIINRMSPKQPPIQGPMGYKVKQQTCQVWIHRDPGSMLHTDEMAQQLETWLKDRAGVWVDGVYIMECRWQFTSEDGYDDMYKTTTRYVTVTVTYSEGPAS